LAYLITSWRPQPFGTLLLLADIIAQLSVKKNLHWQRKYRSQINGITVTAFFQLDVHVWPAVQVSHRHFPMSHDIFDVILGWAMIIFNSSV
jgi:hypothetical protein